MSEYLYVPQARKMRFYENKEPSCPIEKVNLPISSILLSITTSLMNLYRPLLELFAQLFKDKLVFDSPEEQNLDKICQRSGRRPRYWEKPYPISDSHSVQDETRETE
jgi:hypothetical protein